MFKKIKNFFINRIRELTEKEIIEKKSNEECLNLLKQMDEEQLQENIDKTILNLKEEENELNEN